MSENQDTEKAYKEYVMYSMAPHTLIDTEPRKRQKHFLLKNGEKYKHRRITWDSANGPYRKPK